MKLLSLTLCSCLAASSGFAQSPDPQPFGPDFPALDVTAVGEWWTKKPDPAKKAAKAALWMNDVIFDVPRDQTVAFALYTHDHGVLKMSAQLVPLLNDEPRTVRLEVKAGGEWKQVAEAEVVYPGWSAHFRIEKWDATKTVPYRVRHGEKSMFEGSIRRDPVDKDVIVVGSLSCNSNQNREARADMIRNLKHHDPDFLFFAGDQSYDHRMHTAAWLLWGKQFREVIKDRPVVTIPDDHDIGQGNLWGEGGIKCSNKNGDAGGYVYPAEYVKMVERCQTWHLPDPFDPTPVAQGINVYYTRLRVGGIDFAVLEDRKFKSGPNGKIPKMGPRADHINDPSYDRRSVDKPEIKLLGDRQLKFLGEWTSDWTGSEMKAVLSQTAFCGAVHLHGSKKNRLLADLDCNGWPQTGRNKAVAELRRCRAVHLCGDQHLAVVVQHGIEEHRDGPFAFTSPAIFNNYYGRWWWPEDEKPGANPPKGNPLPWTGDFLDGLGNRITMLAYANPGISEIMFRDVPEQDNKRADGYGIARFDKKKGTITFECWPREGEVKKGLKQYAGWPITVKMEDNDGRRPSGHIEVPDKVKEAGSPVISVIDEATGEALYTQRFRSVPDKLPVFGTSRFTIRYGKDKPSEVGATGLKAE